MKHLQLINRIDKHPVPKKYPRSPRSPHSVSLLPSIQNSYHSFPQRSLTHSTPHIAAASSDSPTARTTRPSPSPILPLGTHSKSLDAEWDESSPHPPASNHRPLESTHHSLLSHSSYRTHRGLLTQTFDIRAGVMLTAIQNHFHIVLVQIHFLTLQQDLEQLKTRSFIRQRNLRPILPRSPTYTRRAIRRITASSSSNGRLVAPIISTRSSLPFTPFPSFTPSSTRRPTAP